MIPGMGERQLKSNYRRSQTLGYRDGVPIPRSDDCQIHVNEESFFVPPNHLLQSRSSGTVEDLKPHPFCVGSSKKSSADTVLPRYVIYDRLSLRFDGYYLESSAGWSSSHDLIRYVKVLYFLEDDTMTVIEPVVPNSGLPQGKLIQRHKFEKETGGHWHWKDLNVAHDLRVFGRSFRLISCDQWTREFLTSAGIVVNPPEEAPQLINDRRGIGSAAAAGRNCKSAPQRKYPLKQFLQHDGKILKFVCIWDRRYDASALYDERRKRYALRYFLVDDTIQIADDNSHQPRDSSSTSVKDHVLLRRQKVPKEPRPPLATPADVEGVEFYGVEDLRLGATISIHGRPFILIDCDDFTKDFYRANYNIIDFRPINIDSDSLQ